MIGAKAAAAKAAGVSVIDELEADAPGGGFRVGGGLREKLRSRRGLQMVTLMSLAAVVLLALPAFFGLRSATDDPVFDSLNSLDVPSWAAQGVEDKRSGSQWCFIDCTFRERTADSEKALPETTKVYTDALVAAGWQPWKVAECPETPISPGDGTYGCFRRDEFTLDLWVHRPDCAVDQVAAQDPAVAASAPPPPAAGECVGSTVSIKVQEAIADTRGKPDPQDTPLIGETPDPVLSNDPLLEPTPKAS